MKPRSENVTVGARVKIISQHWLRGYEEAVVIDFKPGAQNNWLVQFQLGYPGGGIEGDKLWLNESYFCEVKPTGDDDGAAVPPERSFAQDSRGLQ